MDDQNKTRLHALGNGSYTDTPDTEFPVERVAPLIQAVHAVVWAAENIPHNVTKDQALHCIVTLAKIALEALETSKGQVIVFDASDKNDKRFDFPAEDPTVAEC